MQGNPDSGQKQIIGAGCPPAWHRSAAGGCHGKRLDYTRETVDTALALRLGLRMIRSLNAEGVKRLMTARVRRTGSGFVGIRRRVWQPLVERYRKTVIGSHLPQVDSVLQRQGEVIHLVGRRLQDQTPLLGELDTRSRDFC